MVIFTVILMKTSSNRPVMETGSAHEGAAHDAWYLKKRSLMEHHKRGSSLRSRFSASFSYSAPEFRSFY